MDYDHSFDQVRLDQLAGQYLSDSNITGRVLFFSESEVGQLDSVTLQFDDDDYETIKNSGFKFHLMELLNTLLEYRGQNNQPNASQGMVNVAGSTIFIEWLSKESAEAFRNG